MHSPRLSSPVFVPWRTGFGGAFEVARRSSRIQTPRPSGGLVRKSKILQNHYQSAMESSLTVKFRGAEAELLDRLVRSGLFATKSEALRASLVKYGADLGLLRPRDLWAARDGRPGRPVAAARMWDLGW